MPECTTIRVAIVDDHVLMRESLGTCVGMHPSLTLAWTAGSVAQASQNLAESETDVILLDLDVGAGKAFRFVRQSRLLSPSTKVVVLTNNACESYIAQAYRVQVEGYLLKCESLERVLRCVETVVDGERHFSRPIARYLRFDPVSGRHELTNPGRLRALTERQLDVLRLLADGKSAKEIARELDLSLKSVEGHKYRIMCKLGLHDRVALARYAIREGVATL